jgi:hypothetical protein
MINREIFGAIATIHIVFQGTLRQLAEKLALALNISAFEVAPSEYSPHVDIGSVEVLGWEVWLKPEPGTAEGNFLLQIETEHAVDEIFHGRMHDLSPWFARFISVLCDVKATPAPAKSRE